MPSLAFVKLSVAVGYDAMVLGDIQDPARLTIMRDYSGTIESRNDATTKDFLV